MNKKITKIHKKRLENGTIASKLSRKRTCTRKKIDVLTSEIHVLLFHASKPYLSFVIAI